MAVGGPGAGVARVVGDALQRLQVTHQTLAGDGLGQGVLRALLLDLAGVLEAGVLDLGRTGVFEGDGRCLAGEHQQQHGGLRRRGGILPAAVKASL